MFHSSLISAPWKTNLERLRPRASWPPTSDPMEILGGSHSRSKARRTRKCVFPSNSLPVGHRLQGTAFLHQRLPSWDIHYPPTIATAPSLPSSGLGELLVSLLRALGSHELLVSFNHSHTLEIVSLLNSCPIWVCHVLPAKILTDTSAFH